MTDDELLESIRLRISHGGVGWAANYPREGEPQTILTPDGRERMVEVRLLDVTGA